MSEFSRKQRHVPARPFVIVTLLDGVIWRVLRESQSGCSCGGFSGNLNMGVVFSLRSTCWVQLHFLSGTFIVGAVGRFSWNHTLGAIISWRCRRVSAPHCSQRFSVYVYCRPNACPHRLPSCEQARINDEYNHEQYGSMA